MYKSPLRYPGGKSRAIKIIIEYFPKSIKVMSSHFVGGGSIELYLSENNKIIAYDNFDLLINFWNQLKYKNKNLHNTILKYYPLTKEQFLDIQKNIYNSDDEVEMAAKFYVLNRCSFSGSTLSGGMSLNHPRFNINLIHKLQEVNLKNIEFICMDFKESILLHQNNFKYLDPPYYIENNLYGVKGGLHKNFDHIGLNGILKQSSNWVLSYNDCEYIRKLYEGCKIIQVDWKYGMSKDKKSNEILIIN